MRACPLNGVCGSEYGICGEKGISELWSWNFRWWSVVVLCAWQHAYVPVCVCVCLAEHKNSPKKNEVLWSKRARVLVQGQHTYTTKPTQQKIKYALWIPWCSCRFWPIHFAVCHHRLFASLRAKFIRVMTWFFSYRIIIISIVFLFFLPFFFIFIIMTLSAEQSWNIVKHFAAHFLLCAVESLIKWPIA